MFYYNLALIVKFQSIIENAVKNMWRVMLLTCLMSATDGYKHLGRYFLKRNLHVYTDWSKTIINILMFYEKQIDELLYISSLRTDDFNGRQSNIYKFFISVILTECKMIGAILIETCVLKFLF